ncbi:MAG: T9SS type A sorting domain-containing protein [Lewinellaceae bacterium]|nr:T9SS type A sorting domain-containing protein [Lewinellaceae bacterium]
MLIPFNDGIPNYVTKVTQFKTGTEVSKVNDINFVNDFELYPVPATQGNNVSIQFNSSKYIDSSIKILDILGNIVTSNGFRINAGVNNYLLNTTSLAKGIYFVRIEAENKILTKKLIIQ